MRKPKANRAYSLDLEVIAMLERYAAASDTWGKRKSRSKIVNDAIRWYIGEGYAEKLESHDELLRNFTRVCKENAKLIDKLRDTNRFDLN